MEDSINIQLHDLTIDKAVYLYRICNKEDKTKLIHHFKFTFFFPFSNNYEERCNQFNNIPKLLNILNESHRFNSNWDNGPINLMVKNNTIELLDSHTTGNFNFFLRFRSEKIAKSFILIFEKDILEISSLLIPFHQVQELDYAIFQERLFRE